MRKITFILSVFTLILSNCGQSQKEPKEVNVDLSEIISYEQSPEEQTEVEINNPQNRLELSNSWHYKHTNLSDQFDIELTIEFYLDTVTYQDSWQGRDSLMVKLLMTEKKTRESLDCIVVNPIIGYPFLNDESRFVTSYSTGFNADKEIVDSDFGSIVVADVNFDGKDDIAVVHDGGNSGPYYIFFIQNEKGKFVKNEFLTEQVSFFPQEIDFQHKQITTGTRSGARGAGYHTYQLDSTTDKWAHIRYEYIGQDGHFVYKIDPITNERIEISRKLNEEQQAN